MKPVHFRCLLVAGCSATALVAGRVSYDGLSGGRPALDYRHVAGVSVGYTPDYGYLIEIAEPGVARGTGTVVKVDHDNGQDPGMDRQGRALTDLSRELQGQSEIVRLCAEHTTLPIIKRQLNLVDFSSWGASGRKPYDFD